jgi:hypothetical protein
LRCRCGNHLLLYCTSPLKMVARNGGKSGGHMPAGESNVWTRRVAYAPAPATLQIPIPRRNKFLSKVAPPKSPIPPM